MHVLLIAHYFPPDGGAGSQRPASFAQHMPALGIDLTVVARDVEESTRGAYDPRDTTLVARTGTASIRRARKTAAESWTTALAREARAAILARRPDVLLVTLSPFEHAQAGFALREEFGIPLVLDLRDPWALDGWHTYRHHFEWRRARNMMKSALEAADGVVMNVPEAGIVARGLAPRRGMHPYGVVTNGWEESDFPAPGDVAKGAKFRIRFAGGFFCRFMRDRSLLRSIRALLRGRGETIDERGRSPLFLLQAIQSLREDPMLSDIGNDFVLEVAGAVEPETRQIIEETESGSFVRQLGYLPHDESVRFIAQADALLLPMHGLPPRARARMVPGKLYEYFGTGRPILGLCPEGDARDWIGRDPRSRVADPVDFEEIAAKLCEMHAMWRRGEYVHSRRAEWTAGFTRRAQAEQMAAYLASVLASTTRTAARPASAPARAA